MNLNNLFEAANPAQQAAIAISMKKAGKKPKSEDVAEEKVRLDPKCWTGKKIGNPKTKMKGGVRVNNCVPAESINEFALPGGSDGDSGRWYTDDELADIIGDDWFEDFDVSNDGFDIDTHGEKAKQNLASYANSWFDDKGYNVNVMGVDHNEVDHDLKWYIVGSFQNDNFADKDVDEGLGSKLAGLGLAGAMALGSAGANARVTPDGQGGFTGGLKPSATVTAPADNKPAAEAPKGFSKEYLQKAADPNRFGRYMISVEKAQELLKNMQEGVAEGWQEDSQELEDWSKEVNKKLYRAHENQRRSLAIQLSKLEQKHFGSELTNGPLTNIVFSTLQALNKGQMVHYDPQSVGQMPFGNIVGDDARIIAASGLKKYDVDGYRGLKRAGIVDTIEQFLHLRDLADNQGQAILKYANMPPVAAWMQFIKDIGWSKDDMNEEVQAKTDDKLRAYYAQRKAEKQKQQQGATATLRPVESQTRPSSFQAKPMSMSLEDWKKEILAKYPNARFATERRPNGSTLAGELGGGHGQGGLGIYSPSTGEVRVGPTGTPSQPLRIHPKQQGVAEAGYRNYDDNRTGFSKNSQAYRADGGANDENHESDRQREQQEKSGTWYIRLNGKLIKDKQGNPYSFRGKAAANKAALTMQSKLFNQGKEFVLTTNPNDKQQGVAEADMDRRGFLRGLGAAALAGAAGVASADQQQDLGNGFVLTTIDVAGHKVKAVLDTERNVSFTLNRGANGSAIYRTQARFLSVKDGKIVDTSMDVGPATKDAMKKAGLLPGLDEGQQSGYGRGYASYKSSK